MPATSNPRPDAHRLSDVDPVVYSTADTLPDPDYTTGSSALIHVGDRISYGFDLDTSTHALDVFGNGHRWYRLHVTVVGSEFVVEYIHYTGGTAEGAAGRREPVDGVRDAERPALGGAGSPDHPGAAQAGAVADGTGERREGVPDADHSSVPDYGDDTSHAHQRPYFHDHEHQHADGDGRAFPPTPRHGHIHTDFFEHHAL